MGRKISALILSFACLFSVLCADCDVQARVIHENDLEDYIMEEMSAANILGMGISIVSADKELYCAAYGTAQKTSSDYVLGDLSKSFTAAGIMRMVEDGDLSLEDTVSDYLPKYKSVSDVTVQELLYQTSGITAKQRMSELEVTEKRGTFENAYANYNLLGEIIEEVSGMTYEEYISDNILDPLDMVSTYSLRTENDESEEMLTGYQSYFGFPSALRYQYDKENDWIQVPSGYLISDIKDMGKYLQMYLKEGDSVLSKDSVHRMLYDGVAVPSGSEMPGELFEGSERYGMGWVEKEAKGQTILYHTGTVENFTSLMVLLPDLDMGITMLFNSMDYLVGQKLIQTLEEGIISIELGEKPIKIDSRAYLVKHGVIDAIMLFVLIASWMPILLMGGWVRRRKKQLIYMPGLCVDFMIQIVLPTVLIFVLPSFMPSFIAKRLVPDVYYVAVGVICSLYLGGLIKLITGIVIKTMPDKKVEEIPEIGEEGKETGQKDDVAPEEEQETPSQLEETPKNTDEKLDKKAEELSEEKEEQEKENSEEHQGADEPSEKEKAAEVPKEKNAKGDKVENNNEAKGKQEQKRKRKKK